MKIPLVALAIAGGFAFAGTRAYAEDTPSAPAAEAPATVTPVPAAPPPAPAATVVVGSGGSVCCQPACCARGWAVWAEPMLVKFYPAVSNWASQGDAAARPNGVVFDTEYDWDLGVRAGVAYMAPGSRVGFGVQVTWASAESDESAAAAPGGTLGLTHSSPDGPDFVLDGTATHVSEIEYLLADVGAFFHLCLGASTDATVYGGFRFAKIDHDVTENLFAPGGALAETLEASTSLRGYGLVAGGELRWKVCGGWSFYGKAAGGILLSTIEGRVLHTTPATTLTSVGNDMDRITPFVEMGVGFGWASERFLGSCFGLHVDLGVELANWFNVLDPLTYVDDVKDSGLDEESDDLGLAAVTLKVTLTF
jgi:hypothetical protein